MAVDYRTKMTQEFARRIKALGFRVYIAERGTYGFITDDTARRVLDFSFDLTGNLGGNYGPGSKESGTGWKMDIGPEHLITAKNVRDALYAFPPPFCGKGWSYMTTVEQYLKVYNSSSKYVEFAEPVQ